MNTSITPSQARTCTAGTPWYQNPLWLGLGVVGLLAVVLYAGGHLGRAASYWPYLLLLACPLMHLFMCRGKKREASSTAAVPTDSAER